MRTITTLIVFAWLACASTPMTSTADRASTSSPQVQTLRVFKGHQLTMQMTPDGHILSGAGKFVGEFDPQLKSVRVGKVEILLDQVVRAQSDEGFELDLPVGAWVIRIATTGEVAINGDRWGRAEGLEATRMSWVRLEALFAVLPLLPAAAPSREP